jgi:hypothetical protein
LRAYALGGSYTDATLPSTSLVDIDWLLSDRGNGSDLGGNGSGGASGLGTLYIKTSAGRIWGIAGYRGPATAAFPDAPTSLGEHCINWGSDNGLAWRDHDCSIGSDDRNTLKTDLPELDGRGMRGLSTNNAHSCGVGADGYAYCWGLAYHGEVGNGLGGGAYRGANSQILVPRPFQVTSIGAGVAQVVAGATSQKTQIGSLPSFDYVPQGYSLARMNDGRVFCWGRNTCGAGSLRNVLTPTLVPLGAGESAVDVTAGSAVSDSTTAFLACAALASGKVKCWGNGYTDVQEISGITNAVKVSAGWDNACALLANGRVRCWGTRNDSGDLGTGDDVPPGALNSVEVSGLTDAVEILKLRSTTCARRADASVWCWGYETTGRSKTPVMMAPAASAKALTSIASNPCYLSPQGRLFCWGGDMGTGVPRPIAPAENNLASLSLTAASTSTMRSPGACLAHSLGVNPPPQRDLKVAVVGKQGWALDQAVMYQDESCQTPLNSFVLPRGASALPIFVKPTTLPTDVSLRAWAEGYESVTSPTVRFAGPPARLHYRTVEHGSGWRRIEFYTRDTWGNVPSLENLSAPVLIQWSGSFTSPCGGVSGPFLTADTSQPITSLILPVEPDAIATLYYRVDGAMSFGTPFSYSGGLSGADTLWGDAHCGCSGDCGGGGGD